MGPGIGELLHPEDFPCPVCGVDEGVPCLPSCYAGWVRARFYVMEPEEAKRRLEHNRQQHLARQLAEAEAERAPVPTEAASAEEPAQPRQRKKQPK